MKCLFCGRHFTPNPKAHGQKFCSRLCAGRARGKGTSDNRINNRPRVKDFETIPQAPNYEVNSQGDVRNKSTGVILQWLQKKYGTPNLTLHNAGKRIYVTLPSLMWLVHGQIIAKKMPVPVAIQKGTRYLRFDTLSACAKFLTTVTHFHFAGALSQLSRRHTQIADWKIRYIESRS